MTNINLYGMPVKTWIALKNKKPANFTDQIAIAYEDKSVCVGEFRCRIPGNAIRANAPVPTKSKCTWEPLATLMMNPTQLEAA